tara:strand:+ start:569 stop:976 length:408 start_codon:yes stop_codon:yes gene_type:complete
MALIGESDSRPGLIGYEETNKPLYSEIEIESTNRILKEYEQKIPETIFDLTLNQIVEDTVDMVGNFSNEYLLKVNEVNLESKLYGEDQENFFANLQKYLVAFMLYLGEKNNLLYFGIILVILSIIIYFFNISRND